MTSPTLDPVDSLGDGDPPIDSPGIGRDPNADRDSDHYGPGAGGKKRKVPAFGPLGRQDDHQFPQNPNSTANNSTTASSDIPKIFPVRYHTPASAAATNCSFRKALYLRRKAALITLYIDAQNAIISGATKLGPNGESPLMDVPAFEKLMLALEDMGMSDWPPDKPSWRTNWDDSGTGRPKTLEQWRAKFDQRVKARAAIKPMKRGGWAPEGSFEFEMRNSASDAIRMKARDEAALHKLVVDLRAIALTAKPVTKPLSASSQSDKPPAKTARTNKRIEPVSPAVPDPIPLSQTVSKESDSKLKTKKKKKKRSVLANQGNPHHVDNYRPNRKLAAHVDPYEPYPHHESLLFPPPMRLLAAVPQRKTAPLPGTMNENRPVRPAEDDFICCFCEIDLFYSSEKIRKRAIRRLKMERRRKEHIRSKAKDVADGKGNLKDDESEYDEEEEWCGDEDGHGRCTCGRQITDPHRSVKSRMKPPETDPPHNHHHHHDHGHDHHDHHHDHDHHDHDHHHHHDDDHDHDHHDHTHNHNHNHDHLPLEDELD